MIPELLRIQTIRNNSRKRRALKALRAQQTREAVGLNRLRRVRTRVVKQEAGGPV